MSDSQNPEQQLQSILRNVSVGGNLSTGDITQIFKIFVNLDQIPKPQGIPQNIVSSSTDKFVGRERDLENLNQQLQRNNQVVIAAVEGMGGVGKTELAIQYSLLNLQLETYPGGICWIRAREQDIGLQIVNFARIDLNLNPPDDLELPDRVRWCWKRWWEGNTLIVLDDVKNYSDITPYLPPQPSQFKVLITTRLKLDLPNQSRSMNVLTEDSSLELLSQWIGEDKIDSEFSDAKELCLRLGYLPLALNLVGRYIKKRKISLTEMLRRLEKKGLQHQALSVETKDRTLISDSQRGIAAAFEVSWQELSHNAQQLGFLLSLFALAPISWDLLKLVSIEKDEEDLEDARIELEVLYLLQGNNPYHLHQLIWEFFKKKFNETANETQYKFYKSFANEMARKAEKIPKPRKLTRSFIESIDITIPHIEQAANYLIAYLNDKDLIIPFQGLGRFYEGQGLFNKAVPWYRNCLAQARKRFPSKHPDVATSLSNLGVIYDAQGRYSRAEHLLKLALKIRKNLYLGDHPDVATSLNNLAWFYDNKGDYSKVEPLYLKALNMRKRLFASDHPDIASSQNNLAWFYHVIQKDLDKAEPLYQEALNMRKRLFTEENPIIASSLINLASVRKDRGLYSEAEKLILKAIEIRKKLQGEDHFKMAACYKELADVYKAQDNYSEAQSYLKKALVLREKTLGLSHPKTIEIKDSLVELLRQFISENKADLETLKDNTSFLIQSIIQEIQVNTEK